MITWVLACSTPVEDSAPASGDTDADTDADTDTDTDTDTDSDTDTDTDSDTDTDTDVQMNTGLVVLRGAADLADTWTGTESVVFTGDMGLGEVLCEVTFPVAPVAPRADCVECLLAWDVVFGAPEVRVDTLCALAGYDTATLAAIEGDERSYGLALDFLGHANALMVDDGTGWSPAAFVDWDAEAVFVTYDWDQGYVEYPAFE
jgi:hypothetical protein